MWCPEGYVSLAEIASDAFGYAQGRLSSAETEEWLEEQPSGTRFKIDTGPPMDECEAFADWFMARFLEQFARDIRVACPSGSLLRLRPDFFAVETDDPFDFNDYREFPDTREGRLRAGSVRPLYIKFEGMRITDNLDQNWDASMRLIANFPLCVPESCIPIGPDELIALVTTRAALAGAELDEYRQGSEYQKLAQDMIDAWDRGELPTKAVAKARFGRGRGAAEWQALWQALAIARPLASRAGRRSAKNR
jgi:hypothetical protein